MMNRRQFIAFGSGSLVFAPNLSAKTRGAFDVELPEQADVLVIGGGGAGLAAALSAAQAGASVVLAEAEKELGGNTLRSAGYMNAVAYRRDQNDSTAEHEAQTLWAGEYRNRPDLVRVLCREAAETTAWLARAGVRFLPGLQQPYGAISCRAVRPVAGSGRGYVEPLVASALQAGVKIFSGWRAIGVQRIDADGLRARVSFQNAQGQRRTILVHKAIVAATGGFSGNQKLCALYEPRLAELQTVGAAALQGDFTEVLFRLGAETFGMDYIGLGPCSFSRSSYILGACGIEHLIFVNKLGERFYPEDGLADMLAEAVLQSPDRVMFALFDDKSRPLLLEDELRALREAEHSGDVIVSEELDALADLSGIPARTLEQTVARFNQAVRTGNDPLGRKAESMRHTLDKPPFRLVRLKMGIQLTLGGLQIDSRARLRNRLGAVIPGFFAAGEAVGGFHGINRLEGNALSAAFTFGRIAGREAAAATPP